MISDDMVRFVKNDLIIFGSSVVAFLVIVLALIFRSVRGGAARSLCLQRAESFRAQPESGGSLAR